jgi:hypothetical protein
MGRVGLEPRAAETLGECHEGFTSRYLRNRRGRAGPDSAADRRGITPPGGLLRAELFGLFKRGKMPLSQGRLPGSLVDAERCITTQSVGAHLWGRSFLASAQCRGS